MKTSLLRLLLVLFMMISFHWISAQTTADYNKQAKAAYDKSDYDGVVNAATLSLNVNLNGEAYWWRALGYKYKKNYTLAISDVTKAISYYSGTKSSLATLYSLRADMRFEMKYYDEAIDDYEQALLYDVGDKKKVYRNLIKAYEAVSDHDGAIPYYDDLLKLETNTTIQSDLLYGRAIAKSQYSDYALKDIISDINKAIEKNRQNSDALFIRGSWYIDEKKYELAKADFNEVIRILEVKSKSKDDTFRLASSYLSQGSIFHDGKDYEQAKQYYQKVLRYDPNNGSVYWNMARLKSVIDKNYQGASEDYRKAIKLLPEKSDKAKCYIDLYLHERAFLQFNKAMEAIDGAIAIYPNNGSYYWDKGYLYKIKKDNNEALKSYNKAFTLGINDSARRAAFYLERGQFKLSNNDAQGALSDIQNSIALRPSYENYKALGDVFKIGMKQMELAEGNYQKAMRYAISGVQNQDTSSNYAYAAAAMGDKKTAERFIKKMIIDASAKVGALANEYHNAACIYATLGNTTKALEYLDLSLQVGYSDFEHMLHDADLEPLYKLPEYKNLLVKYKVPTPTY
jgi:tetratricopeptide (TPR) repeat protein